MMKNHRLHVRVIFHRGLATHTSHSETPKSTKLERTIATLRRKFEYMFAIKANMITAMAAPMEPADVELVSEAFLGDEADRPLRARDAVGTVQHPCSAHIPHVAADDHVLRGDGQLAGLMGVADPTKPAPAEAIEQVHDENIRIVMLTGDSRTTAEAVAKRPGIERHRRGDARREALPCPAASKRRTACRDGR